MVKLKSGNIEEKMKIAFPQEKILSVKFMRQMFIMLTDRAVYYIPKAKPELKMFYSFSTKSSKAIVFVVNAKVFVIRILNGNVMKIYTTIQNMNLTFLFKIVLKKFSKMKFFENEKMLLLWNKKKIYSLDLKKVLLKDQGGYTAYKLKKPIDKIIKVESLNWGFKFSFLTTDGIIRSVSIKSSIRQIYKLLKSFV